MKRPSDDQHGYAALAVPVSNRLGSSPFVFTMYSCGLPDARTWKTRRRLSGDQRGGPISSPSNRVSCTGFDPSRSHIQTCPSPDRSDTKAIACPSGAIAGHVSPWLDEMRRVAACAVAVGVVR